MIYWLRLKFEKLKKNEGELFYCIGKFCYKLKYLINNNKVYVIFRSLSMEVNSFLVFNIFIVYIYV